MRRNTYYVLERLCGVPYLMPYGQSAADMRRGLRLNDTGEFLWDLLEKERTRGELLDAMALRYQASPEDLPRLCADLDAFLQGLRAQGALEEDGEPLPQKPDSFPSRLTESGLSSRQPDDDPLLRQHDGLPSRQPDDDPLLRQTDSDSGPVTLAGCEIGETRLAIGGIDLAILGPPEAISPHFAPFQSHPAEPSSAEEIPAEEILAGEIPAGEIPEEEIPAGISPAKAPAQEPDLVIRILPCAPKPRQDGQMLLQSRDMAVLDSGDRYVLLFPQMRELSEARLSKDGSRACYYCAPPYTEESRENLFHAMRIAFLYQLLRQGMTVVHSSSILYRGRAWLFSAPSGTGKSTHASLWNRKAHTPLINGDLNLLAPGRDGAEVRGLPWCGTSGIFDTGTYPLGGVILLKRSAKDHVEELPEEKKLLLLQQRLITPSWTPAMLEQNLRIAKRLLPGILVCRLYCTPSDHAVDVMQKRIDRFLDEDKRHRALADWPLP